VAGIWVVEALSAAALTRMKLTEEMPEIFAHQTEPLV
jgi:hypothetical protein